MISHNRVFIRFISIVLTLCVIVFISFIALYEWEHYRQARTQLESKLLTLSSTYTLLLAESVGANNIANLELLCISLISDRDVKSFIIHDIDGQILENFGPDIGPEDSLTKRLSIKFIADGQLRTVGYLTISFSQKHILRALKERIVSDILLLVALLMAVLVGTLAAYRVVIGKPLQKLITAISIFQSKGIHHPISYSKVDELGAVINAYNNMQDQQVASKHQLEQYQLKLEKEIQEARKLQIELSHQASHDSLTGLINRREFEYRLSRVLKSSHENKIESALCYMDLDRFKVINDTCGHLAGDELLREITQLLKQHVRTRDSLARLGGDEFGLLLENCSLDFALEISENLRKAVEDFTFYWKGRAFKLGVSIGIAQTLTIKGGINDSLSAADHACYLAKESGRNQIQIYSDDHFTSLQEQAQAATKMEQALVEQRFEIWYQPIVKLDANRASATNDQSFIEILIRMNDKTGIPILPSEFMPKVERYHLATKIDRWVLDEFFSWLNKAYDTTRSIETCAVNLSERTLSDQSLLSFIIDQLDQASFPSSKICFEITETAATSNMNTIKKFMFELKSRGCLIALDDFGNGLSSLTYLKSLPLDFVKIDSLLIKDMLNNPLHLAMVSSINEIVQLMDMKTIAKHVENLATSRKLKEIGITYAQGHAIGQAKRLTFPSNVIELPTSTLQSIP